MQENISGQTKKNDIVNESKLSESTEKKSSVKVKIPLIKVVRLSPSALSEAA